MTIGSFSGNISYSSNLTFASFQGFIRNLAFEMLFFRNNVASNLTTALTKSNFKNPKQVIKFHWPGKTTMTA